MGHDELSPPTRSQPSSSIPITSLHHSRPLSVSERSSSVSSTAANVGVGVADISGAPLSRSRRQDPQQHQHPAMAMAPNVQRTPSGLAYVRSPLSGRSEHRKRPLPQALPRLPSQNAVRHEGLGLQHQQHRQHASEPSPIGMESPPAADANRISIVDDDIPPPPSLFASTGPRMRGSGGSGRGRGQVIETNKHMYLRSSDNDDEDILMMQRSAAANIGTASSYDGSVASSSACSSTIPPLIGERPSTVANNASIWKSSGEDATRNTVRAKASASSDHNAHRWISGASSFDSLATSTTGLLRTTGHAAAGAWTKGSPHIARLGNAATTMISRTLSREEDYDDLPTPTHSPNRTRRGIAEVGGRLGHAAGAMISRTLSREDDFGDLHRNGTPSHSPRRIIDGVGGRLGHAAAMISRTLSREDDYDGKVQVPHHKRGINVDDLKGPVNDDYFSPFVLHRWEDCIFVRAEGGRPGTLMLTSTHLIFEFDGADEEPDYLRSSGQRFLTGKDFISGFVNERRSEEANERKTRRGSDETEQLSTPSSNGGTSDTKSSTLHDDCDSDDDDSYCSDTYQEDMSKAIIRAVEEEARRRLQELDENGGDDVASTVGSVASTASLFFARRQTLGQWARSSARALHSDDDDNDNESDASGFDENRLIAWRKQAEALAMASEHIDEPTTGAENVPEESGQDQEAFDIYTIDPYKARQESQRRGFKWSLSSLGEIYSRAFMSRDVGFEIFAISADPLSHKCESGHVPIGDLSDQSFYIAVLPRRHASLHQSTRRDEVIERLKGSDHARGLNFAYWHSRSSSNGIGGRGRWKNILKGRSSSGMSGIDGKAAESLHILTRAWRKGGVSNFCYLLRLNTIAGRSLHDPSSYPVFPWVLCNYTSEAIPDLLCDSNYRDLSKPMGALSLERLEKFMDKYHSLCNSTESPIPPFMYGSHYSSTGGVPLHFLVRKRPFAGLHRQLQGGSFDLPDRLFRSVATTYELCSRTSSTDVKELTPEFYSDPSFLVNSNGFDLGACVNGEKVGDVTLPPWANGIPQTFVDVMRNALESDICSQTLPSWIDLIFGISSRGSEARKEQNVFYHLTYIEPADLANIVDEELKTETELHIADFGHCPQQLFHQPHPAKRGMGSGGGAYS